MDILVINSGSSSLKYQFIATESGKVWAKGIVDRIGTKDSSVSYTSFKGSPVAERVFKEHIPDHGAGMKKVVALLTDPQTGVIQNTEDILAIGHRIVHGGEKLIKPTLVTSASIQILESVTPISPIHNPGHLAGLKVCLEIFNKAKHVLVMDTSFHQTMPPKAYRYAIPEKYYTEHHIRVYGFHGTSHKYVYHAAKAFLGNAHLKAITMHLGNGSSMAAINEKGEVMDTSMGMTPLDGLVMGTRCGQIDPGVIFFMSESLGMPISEIKNVLYNQSGMLGITGKNDARDVGKMYHQGDANANICYQIYAYRIQKFIGAYFAVLGGAQALVFTAGLGENDALMRTMICKDLGFFGIELDEEKNTTLNHPKWPVEIQAAESKLKILIVPTNEELQIAKEVDELLTNLESK